MWASVLLGGYAGCVGTPRSDGGTTVRAAGGPVPSIEDEAVRELVLEANGFAFDLYRELLAEDARANLFCSPLSLSVALAMTYAGSAGETREQMRDVLRYPLEDTDLHEAFETVQGELDARGRDSDIEPGGGYAEDDDPLPFELSVANAVWGQAGYPFDDAYLDILADHYDSPLREVDFATEPDDVRATINAWVADETAERIDELLPAGSIDGLVRLVLVNAIYFLANWQHPFSDEQTTVDTFTALDGTHHDVAMMTESRRWAYAEHEGAQAVELPYVGGDVSMMVILPPSDAFASFERSFDGETFGEFLDAMEPQEGRLELPRFQFETSVQLSTVLEAMGMQDAFDPEDADFSRMVEDEQTDLHIDQVYHDAFVQVDEEGTEAAAATGVVMRTVSAPLDPFSFVADRPFLFVIYDRVTGTIMFLGRVVDPAGWQE